MEIATERELPGMPEKTPAEQAAEELMVIRRRISVLKEEMELKISDVMMYMRQENRPVLITYSDGDKYILSVNSPDPKLEVRRVQ